VVPGPTVEERLTVRFIIAKTEHIPRSASIVVVMPAEDHAIVQQFLANQLKVFR
jgi:hypothetical protein